MATLLSSHWTDYVLFCTLDIITMTHDNNTDLKLVSCTTVATGCTVHPHRHEVMLSQIVNSVNISKKCNNLIFRAKQSWDGLRKPRKYNSSKHSVTHKNSLISPTQLQICVCSATSGHNCCECIPMQYSLFKICIHYQYSWSCLSQITYH